MADKRPARPGRRTPTPKSDDRQLSKTSDKAAAEEPRRTRTGRTVPPASLVADPLLSQNELCAFLRVSRQTVWHLRRAGAALRKAGKPGAFPEPITITGDNGYSRWRRSEIEMWLDARRADQVARRARALLAR